jgi:hypothetical protein
MPRIHGCGCKVTGLGLLQIRSAPQCVRATVLTDLLWASQVVLQSRQVVRASLCGRSRLHRFHACSALGAAALWPIAGLVAGVAAIDLLDYG